MSSDSLHLFPQSANVALLDSVSVDSAIVDPDDSSQTIVQIFMKPDSSWSILVVVKMNSNGTLGTIEKLMIRNNQSPL